MRAKTLARLHIGRNKLDQKEARLLEKAKEEMTKQEIRQAVREVIAGHAFGLIGHWTEYQESGSGWVKGWGDSDRSVELMYGDPRLTTDEALRIASEEIDRLFKFFKVGR